MRGPLALLLAATCTAYPVGLMARDAGAFGCSYRDRGQPSPWRLTAGTPGPLRVRLGTGVLLVSPEPGRLQDVHDAGTAGLAAGTQNGRRDFVYAVTARGVAVVTARTEDGRIVRGALRVTC